MSDQFENSEDSHDSNESDDFASFADDLNVFQLVEKYRQEKRDYSKQVNEVHWLRNKHHILFNNNSIYYFCTSKTNLAFFGEHRNLIPYSSVK